MIESVLAKHNAKLGTKITVKSLISVGVVALAVLLPQLVHLIAGASGGVQWLPMYLPVLLGGCLLGWKWGLGVGVLSPLVSFAITLLTGNAMPAASRLPYMMAELAVFAAVSGAFLSDSPSFCMFKSMSRVLLQCSKNARSSGRALNAITFIV